MLVVAVFLIINLGGNVWRGDLVLEYYVFLISNWV